jgi:hypothetical protein
MTKTIKIILLIGIFLQIFVFSSFCQRKWPNFPIDTINPRVKINFHTKDSVLPFTIFFTSKYFFLSDGFIDRPEFTSVHIYHNKLYSSKYPLLSDSIFDIYSAFPKLKTMDTIRDDLITDSNYFEELEYSYILNILKEPSLYDCEDKQAIRIISYYGDQYWSDRIEIQDKGVEHVSSCAGFEEGKSLTYLYSRSRLRSKKNEKKLKEVINEIDFDKEQYFSSLNLEKCYPTDRVIIEYRNKDKYYIIRKPRYEKPYCKFLRKIIRF